MEYDLLSPLLKLELEAFGKIFDPDSGLKAAQGYFRSEFIDAETALNVIDEVSKTDKYDAVIPYLAVNYFNRFVLREELNMVQSGVQDSLNLLAFSFLSIAWKLRKKQISITKFLEDLLKCMETVNTVWVGKQKISEPSSTRLGNNIQPPLSGNIDWKLSPEFVAVRSNAAKAYHDHAASTSVGRKQKIRRAASEHTLTNLSIQITSPETEYDDDDDDDDDEHFPSLRLYRRTRSFQSPVTGLQKCCSII